MVSITTNTSSIPVRSPGPCHQRGQRRLTWSWVRFLAAIFVLSPGSLFAAEITVENYCQLTLARLQLVDRTWTTSDRPPTEQEQAALFQTYGTTMKDYLAMSSARAQEIAGYLAAEEALHAEIIRLSEKIRDYIQARSAP